MTREKENYNAFLLHFLERLNGCESIENKITESLTDICEYYGFKRGFIYQTDGFRYFYLKETVGNSDNILRQRFEISEMTNQHAARINGKNKPFYACRNQNTSWNDVDIVDFYKVDSLLIRQIQDSEGKIIGFIGFGDREHAISFTDEELQVIHLILGSLSKEIAVREYKEREVRASKTLSSIMNNMGVDIYVNSFDSHDMLYANESMAAPYGGIEHFEGKKCWQALYKDKTGECEFCPKKHLIDENGQPTKVYSWDYQRPFDKCWFRVFSAAFAWIDGQIAHVITSVDINHQKTIEEELRVAKEKAENLDRLKSAFLANMSHEIRTPLNAIVGFASLLIESDDKKERQDYVDIMQENTELLLQLISDILDLSKIEAGTLDFTMDHLDIKSFCEDIMRNYDIKEDKPVPVLLAPDLPEYYIYTDKKRLMQVITNFINNALKFTNEGQIILEYRHKAESNEIEFAVTDTGMGIAPDKVDQVFDRFVKLNSFSKGTGLGLSICRSIIEHLGGTIGAESEMGVGSRFWFTHPLEKAN
ncbi:sensor histidine kinase [Bacteroides xylanisolvens]|uniref:sensor histidine kinase n=1 Tax=Bacteroides xylanisolvens TaxID=371601 RepID=UPI001F57A023|nr:ATP-binding protein [Bacteroides xylanisolvens]